MTGNTHATPLSAIDAIVVDTETTGLDARVARIVQIAAHRITDGRLAAAPELDLLVNPGVLIPKQVTAVHGIADADVASAPSFAAVADQIERAIGQSIVIGHTIAYDLMVLEQEAKRAGRPWRRPRALDVRILAQLAMPSLAQYDLDRLAELLGIKVEGRHTAAGDVAATGRIFLALLGPLRERGIRTLAEAETATRALRDRQASAGLGSYLMEGDSPSPVAVVARVDSFPYRHRVGDVMSRSLHWCAADVTLREALRTLLERKVSSALIRTDNGEVAIATERDMLRAIDRHGVAALDTPLVAFATKPLKTIAEDAFVYRAVGRIERLGIRHLAVIDSGGDVVGMVTTRDLLRNRASTAIALGDEIDEAPDVARLAAAWAKLPLVARSLLADDVDPRVVASVASTELCAATGRAAILAEQRMQAAGKGAPPVPYALLVLGSAGRGESLLAADQDNAIVFAEGETGGAVDRWFEELATHIAAILDEVGIPFCKGGVMAKTAAWRHSVAGWHQLVETWVRRQRPEDLLNVDIFFDGAVVHGHQQLGDGVIAHAFAVAGQARDFQMQLSELARRWQAPLTLFGGLRTDGDGRVDLKKGGLLPIFTSARVLAIKNGVRARGTPARLEAVVPPGTGKAADVASLLDAHRTIIGFMLAQQLADGEAGIALSPRVDLKRLSTKDKAALKEALGKVSIATDLVSEGRV